MLQISKQNIQYEIEFNGIKIFQTFNSTKLYKDLFVGSQIFIDNHLYKDDDIIYINELSKFNEFVSLSKKSFLMKQITDCLNDYPIINRDNMRLICDQINNICKLNLLDESDGDVNKIITLLFELAMNEYLNVQTFEFICTNIFDERKLIVFDNVSWIQINSLTKYLNEHSFIIICNDATQIINSANELELIVNFAKDKDYFDVLDYNLLLAHLEKQFNIEVNDNNFIDIINDKNNINNLKIVNFLKNM